MAKQKPVKTGHSCIAGPLIIILVAICSCVDLFVYHDYSFSAMLEWESAAYGIFMIPVVSMQAWIFSNE